MNDDDSQPRFEFSTAELRAAARRARIRKLIADTRAELGWERPTVDSAQSRRC